MDRMTKIIVLVSIVGITVEHIGEDADNGRYNDLGRADGTNIMSLRCRAIFPRLAYFFVCDFEKFH